MKRAEVETNDSLAVRPPSTFRLRPGACRPVDACRLAAGRLALFDLRPPVLAAFLGPGRQPFFYLRRRLCSRLFDRRLIVCSLRCPSPASVALVRFDLGARRRPPFRSWGSCWPMRRPSPLARSPLTTANREASRSLVSILSTSALTLYSPCGCGSKSAKHNRAITIAVPVASQVLLMAAGIFRFRCRRYRRSPRKLVVNNNPSAEAT